MNAKMTTVSLVASFALGAVLWVFPQAPDPAKPPVVAKEKPPQLEKDTWRYQVEAVITPGKDLGVYRVRAWAPGGTTFLINLGATATASRLAAAGEAQSAELVLIVGLYPSLATGKGKLTFKRWIHFGGEKGASTHFDNELPEGTQLKNIMKLKEGAGTSKVGVKHIIGSLDGQEVSLKVYKEG